MATSISVFFYKVQDMASMVRGRSRRLQFGFRTLVAKLLGIPLAVRGPAANSFAACSFMARQNCFESACVGSRLLVQVVGTVTSDRFE